LNDIYLNKN